MLQISHLSFSYQNQPLLENLNLTLSAPEKVAIIGDNGTGKTTLLRLISGELHPDEGSIKTTGNIGFLKQTQDDLQNKSGGERTQIRLAELFHQNPEILLLDEPTNNLDAESKAWLLRDLRSYRGLTLIVSHDRDFLQSIAEKITNALSARKNNLKSNSRSLVIALTKATVAAIIKFPMNHDFAIMAREWPLKTVLGKFCVRLKVGSSKSQASRSRSHLELIVRRFRRTFCMTESY